MANNIGLWGRLVALLVISFFLAACDGDDGASGADGADGADGAAGGDGQACWDLNGNGVGDIPGEDLNGDGVVDVLDCNAGGDPIVIGDGAALSAEEIEALGKLTAVITGVTVASSPVVDFTVTDRNGDPAVGIASGVVWFTFAKLMPADTMGLPPVNGGLPYWQSYVNRVEDVANNAAGRGSDVLDVAVQATTDSGFSGGSHVELAPGQYQYTFGTDVTNVTAPIAVPWEPNLTHRVGLEIRLDGDGEVPLAPDNPVFDFVPDGGAGSGVTRNILNTDNCENCHYEFAFHGGPRKTVEYCVTCHNQGTVDQDSGNSLDFAHLLHSIHMGEDRAGAVPFTIYGYSDFAHDYSEVTYPQAKTYCETCHSAATAPDGDNWNAGATAKTCGGCHADGLVAANFDAVTGQAEYYFDHAVSEVPPISVVADGECATCHLGSISSAGPPMIHSLIRGNDRTRAEAGDNFVFEFISATNTGPGEIPVVTFKVSDPAGNPYDIVNAPEFTDSNAALNLYVQWATAGYYGGDENGLVHGGRINDDLSTQSIQGLNFRDTGYPYRMRLGAIKDAITNGGGMQNADGSFTVPFYRALPDPFTGDVVFGLGGHPAWQYTDEEGVTAFERAATVSALYFPGAARETALDSAKCNNCHKRFLAHGTNRNGNLEFCLMCHNGDAAVCSSNPDPLDGSCPAGETQEGYHFGRMIHSIHSKSATFEGGAFKDITYPQSVANCETCHKPGSYNVARTSARAVSTNQGSDIRVWTDDIATTATAAVCGVCHTSTAARGHFESQAGQVDDLKCTIVGAGCGAPDGSSGVGLPNGQEACAVCHGTGAEFETSTYHNPGVE